METLFSSRIFTVVRKYMTGRSGAVLERHVVLHPGAVVILPILPDGRIVLIRQHRIAVDSDLIELPAGTREAAEEPVETARRELIEETGYTAGLLTPVFQFFASPGFVREEMFLFKAENLIAGPTAMEDGEKIETLLVDLPQSLEMIRSGAIRDAKTMIGLLWHAQQTAG